jgi:integrase
MPRLVNRLPKYSLHKNSGQAKVRYGGKDKYLGPYGSPESKEAYAAFIAALPKPGGPAKLAQPARGVVLHVGEAAEHYEAHTLQYYSRDGVPTGEHTTIRYALRPLLWRFRELKVTEFGPKKLKEVRDDMIALGWSRSTINKSVNRIKLCFAWAASEELIPSDIAMGLKTVTGLRRDRTAAKEKAPIGPVADDRVDAVIAVVAERVADICRLMRLTGMRPGEVLAMRASEIDRTDPTCWVYRPGHHKTEHHGKGRAVFIGERGQQILLPRILKAGDAPLFPMTRASLRRAIARGCARAFPHPTISKINPKKRTDAQKAELLEWRKEHQWHPNQIRHTVGTEVRARYGLEAAQVLLGHSRADVTQTYAERDLAKAADVARKIG